MDHGARHSGVGMARSCTTANLAQLLLILYCVKMHYLAGRFERKLSAHSDLMYTINRRTLGLMINAK